MIENMQRPKSKPWLRTIAGLTSFFFLVTNISLGYAAPSNPASPAAQPPVVVSQTPQNFLDTISLPDSIGQIKKTYQGSRNGIVIHIQDAHVNEEAQTNIANVLDYFAGNYGLQLVNLEGAEGDLNTRIFSFVPNKDVLRDISDYFLQEGRLSGPEYLAIVKRPEMKLYGIEDGKIYQENRKAYLDAMGFKKRDEEILVQLGKIIENVSRYVFSDELRELNRRRSDFQEGGKELISYVRFLIETAGKHNVAIHDYPDMHELIKLVEMEKGIDFEKAEKEIDSLTADLKKVISRERLTRFLTNTVQFRMKKIKRSDYYGYLEEEIKNAPALPSEGVKLDRKYSDVVKYLQYMRLYEAIDLQIFDEIEALEKNIKSKLFRSSGEVDLDRLMRIFDIYQKMFEFTLTKQDADFFYAYRSEFKAETFRTILRPLFEQHQFSYGLPSQLEILDQDLERVERFYSAALTRDRILIGKAVEKMESSNQHISAIVTGGFHTPGIEKYLREHDYSYLVIAPRIEKNIDLAKESKLYEDALARKPMNLEKNLTEAFFSPKSAALNDPRFQLSAEHIARQGGINSLFAIGQAYWGAIVSTNVLSFKTMDEAVIAFKAVLPPNDQALVRKISYVLSGEFKPLPGNDGNALIFPLEGQDHKYSYVYDRSGAAGGRGEIKANFGNPVEIKAGRRFYGMGSINEDKMTPAFMTKIQKRSEMRAALVEELSKKAELDPATDRKLEDFWRIMQSLDYLKWKDLNNSQKKAVFMHFYHSLGFLESEAKYILKSDYKISDFALPDFKSKKNDTGKPEKSSLSYQEIQIIFNIENQKELNLTGSYERIREKLLPQFKDKLQSVVQKRDSAVIADVLKNLVDIGKIAKKNGNEALFRDVREIYRAYQSTHGYRFEISGRPDYKAEIQDRLHIEHLFTGKFDDNETGADFSVSQYLDGVFAKAGVKPGEKTIQVRVDDQSRDGIKSIVYRMSVQTEKGRWDFQAVVDGNRMHFTKDREDANRLSLAFQKAAAEAGRIEKKPVLVKDLVKKFGELDGGDLEIPTPGKLIYRRAWSQTDEAAGRYAYDLSINGKNPDEIGDALPVIRVVIKRADDKTFDVKGLKPKAVYPFSQNGISYEFVILPAPAPLTPERSVEILQRELPELRDLASLDPSTLDPDDALELLGRLRSEARVSKSAAAASVVGVMDQLRKEKDALIADLEKKMAVSTGENSALVTDMAVFTGAYSYTEISTAFEALYTRFKGDLDQAGLAQLKIDIEALQKLYDQKIIEIEEQLNVKFRVHPYYQKDKGVFAAKKTQEAFAALTSGLDTKKSSLKDDFSEFLTQVESAISAAEILTEVESSGIAAEIDETWNRRSRELEANALLSQVEADRPEPDVTPDFDQVLESQKRLNEEIQKIAGPAALTARKLSLAVGRENKRIQKGEDRKGRDRRAQEKERVRTEKEITAFRKLIRSSYSNAVTSFRGKLPSVPKLDPLKMTISEIQAAQIDINKKAVETGKLLEDDSLGQADIKIVERAGDNPNFNETLQVEGRTKLGAARQQAVETIFELNSLYQKLNTRRVELEANEARERDIYESLYRRLTVLLDRVTRFDSAQVTDTDALFRDIFDELSSEDYKIKYAVILSSLQTLKKKYTALKLSAGQSRWEKIRDTDVELKQQFDVLMKKFNELNAPAVAQAVDFYVKNFVPLPAQSSFAGQEKEYEAIIAEREKVYTALSRFRFQFNSFKFDQEMPLPDKIVATLSARDEFAGKKINPDIEEKVLEIFNARLKVLEDQYGEELKKIKVTADNLVTLENAVNTAFAILYGAKREEFIRITDKFKKIFRDAVSAAPAAAVPAPAKTAPVPAPAPGTLSAAAEGEVKAILILTADNLKVKRQAVIDAIEKMTAADLTNVKAWKDWDVYGVYVKFHNKEVTEAGAKIRKTVPDVDTNKQARGMIDIVALGLSAELSKVKKAYEDKITSLAVIELKAVEATNVDLMDGAVFKRMETLIAGLLRVFPILPGELLELQTAIKTKYDQAKKDAVDKFEQNLSGEIKDEADKIDGLTSAVDLPPTFSGFSGIIFDNFVNATRTVLVKRFPSETDLNDAFKFAVGILKTQFDTASLAYERKVQELKLPAAALTLTPEAPAAIAGDLSAQLDALLGGATQEELDSADRDLAARIKALTKRSEVRGVAELLEDADKAAGDLKKLRIELAMVRLKKYAKESRSALEKLQSEFDRKLNGTSETPDALSKAAKEYEALIALSADADLRRLGITKRMERLAADEDIAAVWNEKEIQALAGSILKLLTKPAATLEAIYLDRKTKMLARITEKIDAENPAAVPVSTAATAAAAPVLTAPLPAAQPAPLPDPADEIVLTEPLKETALPAAPAPALSEAAAEPSVTVPARSRIWLKVIGVTLFLAAPILAIIFYSDKTEKPSEDEKGEEPVTGLVEPVRTVPVIEKTKTVPVSTVITSPKAAPKKLPVQKFNFNFNTAVVDPAISGANTLGKNIAAKAGRFWAGQVQPILNDVAARKAKADAETARIETVWGKGNQPLTPEQTKDARNLLNLTPAQLQDLGERYPVLLQQIPVAAAQPKAAAVRHVDLTKLTDQEKAEYRLVRPELDKLMKGKLSDLQVADWWFFYLKPSLMSQGFDTPANRKLGMQKFVELVNEQWYFFMGIAEEYNDLDWKKIEGRDQLAEIGFQWPGDLTEPFTQGVQKLVFADGAGGEINYMIPEKKLPSFKFVWTTAMLRLSEGTGKDLQANPAGPKVPYVQYSSQAFGTPNATVSDLTALKAKYWYPTSPLKLAQNNMAQYAAVNQWITSHVKLSGAKTLITNRSSAVDPITGSRVSVVTQTADEKGGWGSNVVNGYFPQLAGGVARYGKPEVNPPLNFTQIGSEKDPIFKNFQHRQAFEAKLAVLRKKVMASDREFIVGGKSWIHAVYYWKRSGRRPAVCAL